MTQNEIIHQNIIVQTLNQAEMILLNYDFAEILEDKKKQIVNLRTQRLLPNPPANLDNMIKGTELLILFYEFIIAEKIKFNLSKN